MVAETDAAAQENGPPVRYFRKKAGANMSIEEQIKTLKKERQAIILAHNYTMADVQDIADFVGDSLELSRKAAECHAPVIVFCGVRFMAETAKILSPESIVLHPNPHAGCPMADMATASAIQEYKKTHAGTTVVAYVNTTAETKTAVDICCTSGNAEKVIESIPPEKDILFLPDRNLGANLSAKLGRKMDLWAGFCPTHNKIMPEHILHAKTLHPQAVVIVHPECLPAVVQLADKALSTGGMLRFARESDAREFIVGTECGILHRMRKENPGKEFHPLEPAVVCPNMKKITLEDVLFALQDLEPRIELDDATISAAKGSIDKMLEIVP
ncbi:MAG: quinolinate synthase NadA [Victivallales bacterium]|nr:quinolinate synthase NadA [Victivallales bacterium]